MVIERELHPDRIRYSTIDRLLRGRFGDVKYKIIEEGVKEEPVPRSVLKCKIKVGDRVLGYYWQIAQVEDFNKKVFYERKLPDYLNSQVKGKIIQEMYLGGGRELAFVEFL